MHDQDVNTKISKAQSGGKKPLQPPMPAPAAALPAQSAETDAPEPTAAIKPFKEFSWLPEKLQTPDRELLEQAKDIVSGVGLVMQLNERAGLEVDRAGGAYLNMYARGILERFAITSCELLGDAIDLHFDRIRACANGGAQ